MKHLSIGFPVVSGLAAMQWCVQTFKGTGKKKGILAHVLAPKRAL